MDYLYALSYLNKIFHLPVGKLDGQLRRRSTIDDRSLSETPFARADVRVNGKDEKVLY